LGGSTRQDLEEGVLWLLASQCVTSQSAWVKDKLNRTLGVADGELSVSICVKGELRFDKVSVMQEALVTATVTADRLLLCRSCGLESWGKKGSSIRGYHVVSLFG
jgi:hypothetical protein